MSQWEHASPARPAKRGGVLKALGIAAAAMVALLVVVGVANHLDGQETDHEARARLQALDWGPLPSLSGAGSLGPFALETERGRNDDRARVRQDQGGVLIETLTPEALQLSARKVAEDAPVRRIRARIDVERLAPGAYVGVSFAQDAESEKIDMVVLDAAGKMSWAALSSGPNGADVALSAMTEKPAAPAGRTVDFEIITAGTETHVFVDGRWSGSRTTIGLTLRALPGAFIFGEGRMRLVSATVEAPPGAPLPTTPPAGPAPRGELDPAAWRN